MQNVRPHMTLRKELRNQLTERFIPELSRIGFVGPDKISGNCIIHEFKRTNSKVTQILDIQFEKYGLARFGKSWGQPAWFLISFSSWKSKKQKGQKQASDACKFKELWGYKT